MCFLSRMYLRVMIISSSCGWCVNKVRVPQVHHVFFFVVLFVLLPLLDFHTGNVYLAPCVGCNWFIGGGVDVCQRPLPCHTHPQFCWLTPEICLPPRVIRASAFPIRAQPSVTWSSGGFHAGQRKEEAAGEQTTLGRTAATISRGQRPGSRP